MALARTASDAAIAAERSCVFLAMLDRLRRSRRSRRLVALDRERADVAILDEARLFDAALGGDAGALDLLAGGDLGLLEGLALGDLQRLRDGARARAAPRRARGPGQCARSRSPGSRRSRRGASRPRPWSPPAPSRRARSAVRARRFRAPSAGSISSSLCSRSRSMRAFSSCQFERDLLALGLLAGLAARLRRARGGGRSRGAAYPPRA